uniref:PIR Superfamily Protein n=1 Tax=Rhabditophanes sp. KR3021 TaxID=114890 RepID=A0AC35UFM4_9BILA
MRKTNYRISAQSHILEACTKNNISHLLELSKLNESLKQLFNKVNLDKIEQHVPVRNHTLNLKVNSNFQGAHTLMGSRFKSHKELKQLYSMWRKLKSDKYDTSYLDLCFTEQEEYIPPDSVKKYDYIKFLFIIIQT